MEDGILTDSQGRKVDFKNTIIVMTSNAGARNITEKRQKLGFASGQNASDGFEAIKEAVTEELKRVFKPEFLNRIDETIVFRQLTKENIREISSKMLDTIRERIGSMGVEITVDEAALDLLAEKGFDPVYGARPLRRAIQAAVEDTAAEKLLDGSIKSGDRVSITVQDGAVTFKTDAAEAAPAIAAL
jgi:ATP-dependent Clp protease ATP-binding subunit ClpC